METVDRSVVLERLAAKCGELRDAASRAPAPDAALLTDSARLMDEAAGLLRSAEDVERILHQFGQASHDIVRDWDLGDHFHWRWHGTGKFSGYERSAIPEEIEWWKSRIHPDDYARVMHALDQYLSARQELWTVQYRFHRADGSWADMEDTAILVRDKDGNPRRVVAGLRDVSEQKREEELVGQRHAELERLNAAAQEELARRVRSEEALLRSEARFRRIFESDVVGMMITNFQGEILHANNQLLGLLGRTRRELELGQLRWDTITPPEYAAADKLAMDELARTGLCTHFEKEYVRADGARVPVLLGIALLQPGEDVCVCFVLDNTERRRAAEELQRLNEELESKVADRTRELLAQNGQLTAEIGHRKEAERALSAARDAAEWARKDADRANRAKSEFLSRMSHELRTPMNAIIGFAQVLETYDLDADMRDCLEHILRAGKHLLNLINEVLDIARIEAGELVLSPEPILLNNVLSQSLDLLRPALDKRRIAVEWQAECGGETWVQADANRLKQVFLNLLSNAIKYNREGGRIALSCSRLEGMVRVMFRDTGIGIPKDKLGRIFIPFDRLGAETTEVEGAGLGLALSKHLVDIMKGRIHIDSSPGEGTTVFLDLMECPKPDDHGPDAPLPTVVQDAISALANRRLTVLHVEDNLSNVALIQRILKPLERVELLTAMHGTHALELASSAKPDVILLDLNLPDMGGAGVLNRLKAARETAHIPVIVISADASPGQIERLMAAGAVAYLTKPIDIAEFYRTLERALA